MMSREDKEVEAINKKINNYAIKIIQEAKRKYPSITKRYEVQPFLLVPRTQQGGGHIDSVLNNALHWMSPAVQAPTYNNNFGAN